MFLYDMIEKYKGVVSAYVYFLLCSWGVFIVMSTFERIKVLDGLRTLAIVLVLLRHSVRPFWQDVEVPFLPIGGLDLGSFFINGWVGVDLFFVLSGFFITTYFLKLDLRGRLSKSVLTQYFKRRFFRIAPVYYLVLLFAVLNIFPFFVIEYEGGNQIWRFFYHLVFMQDYWPSDIIVVFWSLAVEIKFYILAPFLIAILSRFQSFHLKLLLLVLILLSQPLLRWVSVEYFYEPFDDYQTFFTMVRSAFHLCLDGLIVGVMCAFFFNDEKAKSFISKPLIANALFYVGLFIVLSIVSFGPVLDIAVSLFDKTIMVTLISVGFGGMVMGLLGRCYGASVFEGRFLTFFALISYSLYLVHMPMISFTAEIIGGVVPFDGLTPVIGYVVFIPLFVFVSVFLSSILYFGLEKPVIEWSKKD